jgi:uncharacterized protein YndB with AHSA1/START domain
VIPDAIEKDILIDASAESVYRAISEPGQLGQWFSLSADLDPRAGGEGVLTFRDRGSDEPLRVRVLVEAAEPPTRFAFRWHHPDGEQPEKANSLLVDCALATEGSGTRLRVTESGFTALDWPAPDLAAYFELHDNGWSAHLANLRDYVARQS